SWMTSGNETPAGTSSSVKVPSNALVVETSALLICALHCWHVPPATPSVNAVRPHGSIVEPFGTYTSAPAIGSVPFGAMTLPVTRVEPLSHFTWLVQKPVHRTPASTPGP